jgi:hypothetical protein
MANLTFVEAGFRGIQNQSSAAHYQYTTIERSKPSQMVPNHPLNRGGPNAFPENGITFNRTSPYEKKIPTMFRADFETIDQRFSHSYCRSSRPRRRELYANIDEPKSAQTVPQHPNRPKHNPSVHQILPLISNRLGNRVGGSEKAGVGGSIPSLATTF